MIDGMKKIGRTCQRSNALENRTFLRCGSAHSSSSTTSESSSSSSYTADLFRGPNTEDIEGEGADEEDEEDAEEG
jgi:hypothetical protein